MTATASPAAAAASDEAARRRSIAFLNWAHALDHFVLLIYPTVVIGLEVVYNRPYSELIALSSAAFLAFGIFSLPAGWLADRWSRRNMMAAFYFGCGVSLIGVALAPNLLMLTGAMFAIGMFAAIYHPVGMAMLIEASQARGLYRAGAGLDRLRHRLSLAHARRPPPCRRPQVGAGHAADAANGGAIFRPIHRYRADRWRHL